MPQIIIKQYGQTRIGSAGEGTLQLVEPDVAAVRQVLAVGAAPTLSTAFEHEWVQVQSDVDFIAAFGPAPVAALPDFVYPAGPVFTFAVCRGHKMSVKAP